MDFHSTGSTPSVVQPPDKIPTSGAGSPIHTRVNCSGTRHWIVLHPGGALTLPDHTKSQVRKQMDMAELGGVPCRCVRVLLRWRRFDVRLFFGDWDLPRSMLRAWNAARTLRFDRRRRRTLQMELALPPGDGRPLCLTRLANRLLQRHRRQLQEVAVRVRWTTSVAAYLFRLEVQGKEALTIRLDRRWFEDLCAWIPFAPGRLPRRTAPTLGGYCPPTDFVWRSRLPGRGRRVLAVAKWVVVR